MKSPNTIQGMNPAVQFSKLPFFSDGGGVYNDLQGRGPPTAATPSRLKAAKGMGAHGPDERSETPGLVVEKSADGSGRFRRSVIESSQAKCGKKTGEQHRESLAVLFARTGLEHVSIEVSSSGIFLRHNPSMGEEAVLDIIFQN